MTSRPTVPTTLEDAIACVVHESEKPPKAIASEAGVRYGYLLDASNPHNDDVAFQARLIVPVTKASGNDAIVRFLAHAVGGVFYRVHADLPIDELTSRSLKEFGEYLQAVAEAGADRTYTMSEARRVEQQGLEAVEAILAHVDYVRLKAGLGPRVAGVK